jgi:hypothetical protein
MENSSLFKFLELTKSDDRIVNIYKIVRTWLQREGHTTESSKRISGAPAEIWDARHRMTNEIEKLKRDLNNYSIYNITNKLREIDKQFPLKDELDD